MPRLERKRIARFVLRCAACRSIAADIALVPRGVALRIPRMAVDPPPGSATILIKDLFGVQAHVVPSKLLRTTRAAIRNRRADDLHEIEELWVPCYCPKCNRSYCCRRDCPSRWKVRIVWDELWDGSPWYDFSLGVCPLGHQRMVRD